MDKELISDVSGPIREAQAEKGFNAFMENPMTKLVLSLIPAAENPDAVKTLLRQAFESGINTGECVILESFLKHVIKKDDRTSK